MVEIRLVEGLVSKRETVLYIRRFKKLSSNFLLYCTVGAQVKVPEVIVRQRGFQYHPGDHVPLLGRITFYHIFG